MFPPINFGKPEPEPAVSAARASKWHMPWLSLWAPAATWDRANDVLPITKAPGGVMAASWYEMIISVRGFSEKIITCGNIP